MCQTRIAYVGVYTVKLWSFQDGDYEVNERIYQLKKEREFEKKRNSSLDKSPMYELTTHFGTNVYTDKKHFVQRKWKTFENRFAVSVHPTSNWIATFSWNKMSAWCCYAALCRRVPDDGMTFIPDMIAPIIWTFGAPTPLSFCVLLLFFFLIATPCSAFVTFG